MAGYIYCMKNDHPRFGRYVKVGYTERTPMQRRKELELTWRCKFEVLWDLDVYEPARAELFLHQYLSKVRIFKEFFLVDPNDLKQWAENFFDEHRKETEDKEIPPPDLVELAEIDRRGFLLEADQDEIG